MFYAMYILDRINCFPCMLFGTSEVDKVQLRLGFKDVKLLNQKL